MKNIIILFLLCFIVGFNCDRNPYAFQKRPMFNFFMSKAIPKCLVTCTKGLRDSVYDFVNGNISVDSFNDVCSNYENASICIEQDEECVEFEKVFSQLTDGLKWACREQPETFRSFIPCVYFMGKDDRNETSCAESCELLSVLDNPRGIGEYVAQNAGELCSATTCYLNCTRLEMNSRCVSSGSKIVQVALKAFEGTYNEYLAASNVERVLFDNKLPDSCEIFLSPVEMDAIRFDQKLIKELEFIISAKKSKAMDKEIAEDIIFKALQQWNTFKTRETREEMSPVMQWLTIGFIAIVIALNVVGLVFTIYWCVSERNDPQNDTPAQFHFVEPNIRLKMKRGYALQPNENSSQDIQVRVPRNGNQVYDASEQNTIVVPHWKRRRTLSVPLDPRRRTESTGSDQFPQFVVLKAKNASVSEV